ncbi:MAG TPA: nitroreductase family protein, partial [Streptosporangiaceae bacterium]
SLLDAVRSLVPAGQDQWLYWPVGAGVRLPGMRPAGPRGSLRSGETAGLSHQMIEQLLRAAAAAPSMHNTQPWRFRVGPARDVIELRADPARQLPYGDPGGRAVHIACGAALLNLRLAAGVAAGRQTVVRLLPDPGTPLLLATVRFGGPHKAGETERELYAAIERRHTNRQPFSDRPVPPGVLASMTEAATLEGAILHVLDREEAVRVLHLAADAECDQLANPAYRAELARWAGGQRDRDGIPGTALGPRALGRRAPVRHFTPGRPYPAGYARFEAHPQLAVLSVRSGGTVDWLRAGQALERVLLTATACGIATCPLTQPLETADAWLVRDPRCGTEYPQMILRLGYANSVPPTPRRPISDLLDQPDPGDLPPGNQNPQPHPH